METAIYARVSTNNGQDPEMQLRELREYCQRRGWKLWTEYLRLAFLPTSITVATEGFSPSAR